MILKIIHFIVDRGFRQSKTNYSLFTRSTSDLFTAILFYVDDIIIDGDNVEVINSLKVPLDDKFKTKDLGKLKYFLRIEVAQSTKEIQIFQIKYALDSLANSGTTGVTPAKIPLDLNTKLFKDKGETLSNPED